MSFCCDELHDVDFVLGVSAQDLVEEAMHAIAEDPISPISGGEFEASDEAAYQYDNELAQDIAQSLSDSGAWSDDIDGLSLVGSVDPSDQAVVQYIDSIFAFARWQRGAPEPEPEPELRHATESEIALSFTLTKNRSPNHQLFVAFEREREQAAAAEAAAAGLPEIAAVTEEQQIYSLALFDSCAEVVAAELAEIDPTSRRYRRRRSRLGVAVDSTVAEPFFLTQAMLTERVLAQTKWQRESTTPPHRCLSLLPPSVLISLAHRCCVMLLMQSGKWTFSPKVPCCTVAPALAYSTLATTTNAWLTPWSGRSSKPKSVGGSIAQRRRRSCSTIWRMRSWTRWWVRRWGCWTCCRRRRRSGWAWSRRHCPAGKTRATPLAGTTSSQMLEWTASLSHTPSRVFSFDRSLRPARTELRRVNLRQQAVPAPANVELRNEPKEQGQLNSMTVKRS